MMVPGTLLENVARSLAEILGAGAGIVLTLGWIIWQRTRPAECPGGVTIEFHPPLVDHGNYKFKLKIWMLSNCLKYRSLQEVLGPNSSNAKYASFHCIANGLQPPA